MIEIPYKQCGDYLIPDLNFPNTGHKPLGKYGRMREKYLKEHHKGIYAIMLLNGKLPGHLTEVEDAARSRMEIIVRQMQEAEDVNEQMKAIDPTEWTRRINEICVRSEEIVLNELIYC